VVIALIGEGTYPHQFGGVSVWCDQLVRRMPECNFRVLALVASGNEPVRWDLPRNVSSVQPIPLWAYQHAPASGWLRGRSASRAVGELIETLLAPAERRQQEFGQVLRELAEIAWRGRLGAELASESAVALLSASWRDQWPDCDQPAPSLHDAVTAMQLLEHSLRPLAFAPAGADVLHVITNGLGALPALAATWRYDTPIVLTEHGLYMREQYLHSRARPHRWPVKALHLAFVRRLCTLCYQEAAVVAPGNIFNIRWEQRLGADPARIRTVYNGVDPADFPAVQVEPDVPTISWAGRIDPVKDLETLIRAFALVRQQVPDVRLRIFGAAPDSGDAYAQRCANLVSTLHARDAVRFEGRVDKIRDAYAAGHVVVLSSITEGIPYTLIEAMACGRACVATDVGGVREAVGDAGIVVPPRSPEAIAQACLTLLADSAQRHRIAAMARQRALEYFTVDRAIKAYREIYAAVRAAGRPVPGAPLTTRATRPGRPVPGAPRATPATRAGATVLEAAW
jgi:polysaccharide biosynthesis protein PelF